MLNSGQVLEFVTLTRVSICVSIQVNLCRARICASHEHDFGLSLSSFDSTWVKEFENCLDDDPRVRTPIC